MTSGPLMTCFPEPAPCIASHDLERSKGGATFDDARDLDGYVVGSPGIAGSILPTQLLEHKRLDETDAVCASRGATPPQKVLVARRYSTSVMATEAGSGPRRNSL